MKRIFALCLALTASLSGTILVAGPASAALPACTTYRSWALESGRTAIRVPSYGTNIRCLAATGNQGNGVKALQRNLNLCYQDYFEYYRPELAFARLVEDGVFGSKTKAALTKVQRYHGIGADGVYGDITRRAMNFWDGTYDDGGTSGGCGQLANPQ